MIEVYKIFSGKYDTTVTNWLTGRHVQRYYDLRGHKFSILYRQSQISYDTRKYNFTNRIISIWNDIVSVHTVDTFKACLDRFWQKQEVFFYNWKSDIQIGSYN